MEFVTIYEDVEFGGTGIFLDVGEYRLFGPSDMNDVISSIQVPAGLVALVYEHADSGGGYGISADFLEDCADLAPLGLDDKISYISVFRAEQEIVSRDHRTGKSEMAHVVWARGSVENGQYVPGHWERKRVVEPAPNPVVTVSPPIPPHTGGIAVHALGPHAQQAQSLYTLFLHGPDDPNLRNGTGRFDSALTCTFPTLPLGRYWVTADTKADVGWPVVPSRAEAVCQAFQVAQVIIRFG
jgi:hypothetical protein